MILLGAGHQVFVEKDPVASPQENEDSWIRDDDDTIETISSEGLGPLDREQDEEQQGYAPNLSPALNTSTAMTAFRASEDDQHEQRALVARGRIPPPAVLPVSSSAPRHRSSTRTSPVLDSSAQTGLKGTGQLEQSAGTSTTNRRLQQEAFSETLLPPDQNDPRRQIQELQPT